MNDPDQFDLQRFIEAQDRVYDNVLAELRNGAKRSHWIWFVFPQLRGLGRSDVGVDCPENPDQPSAYGDGELDLLCQR